MVFRKEGSGGKSPALKLNDQLTSIPLSFSAFSYLFFFFFFGMKTFCIQFCKIALLKSEVAQSGPTLWTVACQAPPSMGFSRQEFWSGLLFPSLGDLPDPGVEPGCPTLQADSLLPEPPGNPFPLLKFML